MTYVFQEWLETLTWKEQTVLVLALRGTDMSGSKDVKLMTRWLRSIVLKNAAPKKTFMGETCFRDVDDIANDNPLSFDMLPVHFFGHLLHTFEVIAYRHPDPYIHNIALNVYTDMCKYLHINPETCEEMTIRLKDELMDSE
ncbi:MAG: hypothetical protein ACXQS5_00105 [Candidatus Methanospirareceae archaeon]